MKTETVDKVAEKAKAIVNNLSQRGWANNLDLELAMGNCLSRAIDEAILEEREACAKIADEFWEKHYGTETGFINPSGAAKLAVQQVGIKIRGRSENSGQRDS